MGRRNPFFKRLGQTIGTNKKKQIDYPVTGSLTVERPSFRARNLQIIYSAIKGCYDGNPYRYRATYAPTIALFEKTAKLLQAHERKTGEEIDDALFIVAIFRKYGSQTFPGHLASASALNIYESDKALFAIRDSSDQIQIDEMLVKYLSEVRGESPAVIRKKFSELFQRGTGTHETSI